MATITLRKALRVKKQIEGQMRPAGGPVAPVDIDDAKAAADMAEYLAAEERKYLEQVADQVRLSSILATLRENIDRANSEAGVHKLLAMIGHTDRMIAAFRPIAEAAATDCDIAAAKLTRRRATAGQSAPTPHYGHRSEPELTVCVASRETIDVYKQKIVELRQRKEQLEDERLSLNAAVEIEIGDDDVRFLAESGIV